MCLLFYFKWNYMIEIMLLYYNVFWLNFVYIYILNFLLVDLIKQLFMQLLYLEKDNLDL